MKNSEFSQAEEQQAGIFDIELINAELETKSPLEIVAWAVKRFSPRFAMTSSFGPESGVLLHVASQVDPGIPVLFLETGYHFPETLEYRNKLLTMFGLSGIVNIAADPQERENFIQKHAGVPYENDPDACCKINKVDPLVPAIKKYDAWMSGIRRGQTSFRKSVRIVEINRDGQFKISPLANFTSRDTWWYLNEHKIPRHPLYEKGYVSIGCWPCTRPIQPGDDERSGRWAGRDKKECGIHTFQEPKSAEEKEHEKETKNISENI